MKLDFLKLKRQEANRTQAEVAKTLKIGPQAYAKIESGENNLHPKHWKKLQTMLNITRDDLCNFTAEVAMERRKKKTEDAPADPLLQIVLERWQSLTNEQQGRVAGIVFGMTDTAAAQNAASRTVARPTDDPKPEPKPEPQTEAPAVKLEKKDGPSVKCPTCGEYLYGSYIPGETFACPECGQHIAIHHIVQKEK